MRSFKINIYCQPRRSITMLSKQHSLPPIINYTRVFFKRIVNWSGVTEMTIAHRKGVRSCFNRHSKGLQHQTLQSGEAFRPKNNLKSSECDRYPSANRVPPDSQSDSRISKRKQLKDSDQNSIKALKTNF